MSADLSLPCLAVRWICSLHTWRTYGQMRITVGILVGLQCISVAHVIRISVVVCIAWSCWATLVVERLTSIVVSMVRLSITDKNRDRHSARKDRSTRLFILPALRCKLFVLISMILEPDFYLSRSKVYHSTKLFSLGSWEVSLVAKSSLQLVNLSLREEDSSLTLLRYFLGFVFFSLTYKFSWTVFDSFRMRLRSC